MQITNLNQYGSPQLKGADCRTSSLNVDLVDPYADAEEVKLEYQIKLKAEPKSAYDSIIVAVAHHEYREMKEADFLKWANESCLLVDVKGLYRNGVKKLEYWNL